MNRIRFFVFNLIRRIFWKSYNPNEDFTCCCCQKELYHRYLFCSSACSDKFDEWCLKTKEEREKCCLK